MSKSVSYQRAIVVRKTPQNEKVTKRDLRLARHLQKLRKSRKVTQEQLAEKIGKTHNWISYIESGHRIPNLRLLYKIADALGLKVRDLFPF